MFKNILKGSIFVLLAVVVAGCHQDDRHHHRGDGNSVNCYHHNGNVNCHRYN